MEAHCEIVPLRFQLKVTVVAHRGVIFKGPIDAIIGVGPGLGMEAGLPFSVNFLMAEAAIFGPDAVEALGNLDGEGDGKSVVHHKDVQPAGEAPGQEDSEHKKKEKPDLRFAT
jgi:hypothetical protein